MRSAPRWRRADGVVTRDEVAAFGEVFQVPPGEEEHVRLVFDLARKSTAGFESYARQVGRLFAADRAVLENLLGGLFHIALADGRIFPAEDAYLREVARHFGFDSADYRANSGSPSRSAAGGGGGPARHPRRLARRLAGAIREAYHRLVRESHPDLVIAQGLPPECIALATARIARINAAYEQIAKDRAATRMTPLQFRDRASPNHDGRGQPARIDMLVLHYTGMQSAEAAIERLCDPGARVSAHYLVEENGTIWRLVPETRRAFHAGVSCWEGETGLNAVSLGIEIVNPGHEWGYRPFPEAQMASVERLCRDLISRHPIPPHRVVGHSDIAPDRKADPGRAVRLARARPRRHRDLADRQAAPRPDGR